VIQTNVVRETRNPLHSGALTPDNAFFILVSFEGPDAYSQAGGLGVRVSGLARTLAELGFETHLFFVGDPGLAGEERLVDGRLVLHRWSQWLSAGCPRGVYDGEWGKVDDVTQSLPPFITDHLITPAVAHGRIPILLLEEWQTAECAARVADRLAANGIRDRALVAWNANHCYGFERIDWRRLSQAAVITTVSRHMRSIVRSCGTDARVIPNGIPRDALDPIPRKDVAAVRAALGERRNSGSFFKMARWEREKGWTQALDAVSRARDREHPLMLIARGGGPTGVGGEIHREAAERDLRVASFDSERSFMDGLAGATRDGAEVVNLSFGVSRSLARTLYAATDGVLANSVSEPFGLVGLEAMAAGGVAFTGGTGEDYAVSGRNAVVLETLDPDEIVSKWRELASSPSATARLRRTAKKTARDYAWTAVVDTLLDVLEQQGARQGLLDVEEDRARWQVAAIEPSATEDVPDDPADELGAGIEARRLSAERELTPVA
jgi:glycosyltransferase involved in cell wall biosynthesis